MKSDFFSLLHAFSKLLILLRRALSLTNTGDYAVLTAFKKGIYGMKGHEITSKVETKPSVGPPGSGVCVAVRGGADST